MCKALVAAKLKAHGFVLWERHWKDIDRLLKRGSGFVTAEAIEAASVGWGFTEPMREQLREALHRQVDV